MDQDSEYLEIVNCVYSHMIAMSLAHRLPIIVKSCQMVLFACHVPDPFRLNAM